MDVLLFLFAGTALSFLEQVGYQFLFCGSLKRKPRFALRLLLLLPVLLLALFLLTVGMLVLLFRLTEIDPLTVGWFSVVQNLLAVLLLFSIPWALYDESHAVRLYVAVAGKAAHLVGSTLYYFVTELLHCGSVYDVLSPSVVPVGAVQPISFAFYLLIHAVWVVTVLFLFMKPFSASRKEFNASLGNFVFALYLALLAVAVLFSGTIKIYAYEDTAENVLIRYAAVFVEVVFGVMILLMLRFILIWAKDVETMVETRNFHENYKKQTELLQENMKLVNIKCHDMRHQIREIGKTYQVDQQFLREVRQAISVYDTTIKTGNDYLDVLLTEKSLRCEASGIQLTAMIDGAAFAFLSGSDINSFFGNAVDNAIEALQSEAPENRFIRISSSRTGAFLRCRIENYFSGALALDDEGYPITSKDDPAYHGFGVRSMREIASRYDGTVSFRVDEHLFVISALFPQPDAK